jgi:hypothetical protein
MSSLLAKVVVLSYDSAAVAKTSALKSYYRSVRLIRDVDYINPIQPSYITNILLCGNCIDSEKRNLYVFYIDTFYRAAWIIEINIDSRAQKVVYYDKDNDIGFDPLHRIYNPRVVHGRLVWTDNLNPIYQMDIERAKRSWDLKIGYGQYPNVSEWSIVYPYGIEQVVSNGNNFYRSLVDNNVGTEPKFDDGTNWETLCTIEDAYYSMNVDNFLFEPVPPKMPPVVTYQSDDSRKINNLRQTLYQFAYRYVYMDWRKSTFSPASIVNVPQAEEEAATGLANEQISLNNKLQIEVNSGGEEVRAIEIIGRSSVDTSKWFLIETIAKFGEQERGNELSRTSEPGYITVTITLPQPIVTGTNLVNGVMFGLLLQILSSEVLNTYVAASVLGMQWTAEEFGSSYAKATEIDCNPILATLISKPDWLVILSGGGVSLIAGMTVQDGESLSLYPFERPTENRSGYVVIQNTYGDYVTIITTQAGTTPPVLVPIIPIMQVDPFDDSEIQLIGSLCGATSNATTVTYSFVVNHPAYESGEIFDLYWRCVVTRNGVAIANGNGTISGVSDETSNTGSLELDFNLAENDEVVIYISAQAFLESIVSKTDMSIALLSHNPPINSWIESEKRGMLWGAMEGGVAITSLITCPPMNCTITSKPDWLTIQSEAGYSLYVGWTINNGETISFYPTSNNYGNGLSGYVVLSNAYGDAITIIVTQSPSETPPTGIPVECTIQVYSGDSTGLSLPGTSAYALSGNKNIVWSASVAHTAHADEAWTMFWRAKVNGIVQGSGSFEAYVGSNTGEIVLDVTLLAGDIVLIDFSSVTF